MQPVNLSGVLCCSKSRGVFEFDCGTYVFVALSTTIR